MITSSLPFNVLSPYIHSIRGFNQVYFINIQCIIFDVDIIWHEIAFMTIYKGNLSK